jgi:DNA polymerase I-like protein with 3'-5' exonuclease and polymerase domains/uracil-DNA glycosylase
MIAYDANCRRCHLSDTPRVNGRLICVPGSGPIPCDIAFYGEALGAEEEVVGRPFAGQAGQVLDECLALAGSPRASVFVSNVARCVIGSTSIGFPSAPSVGYRRYYEGLIVTIETARGHKLTVTPNHPILTQRGWVAAQELDLLDDKVYSSISERIPAIEPEIDYVPASAEQVFGTLEGLSRFGRIVGSQLDFHGDGANREIEVVGAYSDLRFNDQSASAQSPDNWNFVTGLQDARMLGCLRTRDMSFKNSLWRPFASNRRTSICGKSDPLFESALRPEFLEHRRISAIAETDSFGVGTSRDVSLNQPFPDSLGVNSESLSNLRTGLPAQVESDYLVDVKSHWFAGHVYNFSTSEGWYYADGIITHNCRPPANRKPTKDEITACSIFTLRELNAVQPKVIVCLGGSAGAALIGKDKIAENRGRIHKLLPQYRYDCPVLMTYHPAAYLHGGRDEVIKRAIINDIKLAERIVSSTDDSPPTSFDWERAIAALRKLARASVIAVDCEWAVLGDLRKKKEDTRGSWPWSKRNGKYPELTAIGIAAVVDGERVRVGLKPEGEWLAAAKFLIESIPSVYHNADADVIWLLSVGINPIIAGDSLLLVSLLNEDPPWTLEALGGRYTDMPPAWKGRGDLVKGMLPRNEQEWKDLCSYCLTPETPVLTADLEWKPIGSLKVGDLLLATDERLAQGVPKIFREEGRTYPRQHRVIQRTMVTAVHRRTAMVYRIETSRGSVLATAEHPWLVKQRHSGSDWRATSQLEPGHRLSFVSEPVTQDKTWQGGYVAGAFDADGHMSASWPEGERPRTRHLEFTQKPDKMPNVEHILRKAGFDVKNTERGGRLQERWGKTYERCRQVRIMGGAPEIIRFMAKYRPPRLLPKAFEGLYGRKLYTYDAIVQSVAPVGLQEVINLSTGGRTFVAAGFVTHNCADDSLATWLVNKHLGEMVSQKRVYALYQALMKPLKALSRAATNGIPIDLNLLNDLTEQAKEARIQARRRVATALNVPGYADARPKSTQAVAYALERHLGYLAHTPKNDDPSLAEDALMPYASDPVVADLLRVAGLTKMYGTYLKPFQWLIEQQGDPRIHSLTKLWNVRTGRSAAEGERGATVQQLDRRLKPLVKAREGWQILSGDMSQAELRVAAWLANEPTLLRFYKEGIDAHKATAAWLAKVKAGEADARAFLANIREEIAAWEAQRTAKAVKDDRQSAKASNFGFLYIQQEEGFIITSKKNYGVDFTLAEASLAKQGFFQLYSRIQTWHDEAWKWVRLGYVDSPFGRRRYLPRNEDENAQHRKAVNSPVQNTASDISLIGGAEVVWTLEQQGLLDQVLFIGFVHDAVLFEVRNELVDYLKALVTHHMENPPLGSLGIIIPVPLEVEVKVGQAWSG